MNEIQTPTTQPNRIRRQRCLTFDDKVFEPFQKLCEKRDAVPSRVIERFMDKQINAI